MDLPRGYDTPNRVCPKFTCFLDVAIPLGHETRQEKRFIYWMYWMVASDKQHKVLSYRPKCHLLTSPLWCWNAWKNPRSFEQTTGNGILDAWMLHLTRIGLIFQQKKHNKHRTPMTEQLLLFAFNNGAAFRLDVASNTLMLSLALTSFLSFFPPRLQKQTNTPKSGSIFHWLCPDARRLPSQEWMTLITDQANQRIEN